MQVRVITSIVVASVLVVSLLGVGLTSIMSQQLMNNKYNAAVEEIERVRGQVAERSDSSSADSSLEIRLDTIRGTLVDKSDDTQAQGSDTASTSAVPNYDPILMVPTDQGEYISSPQNPQIPDSLHEHIQDGEVAYEYSNLRTQSDDTEKVLIMGTPVSSDIPNLELYLVMPMTEEENALNLLNNLLLAGSIVLIFLLIGIIWLFSRQLIIPLRNASQTAERFATGHLKERMTVKGEDEVATLGSSFNSMAESLSSQIEHLEEFGSLQRQFTSDVSHELRTPLTSVRMAAELIHDNQDGLDPLQVRASNVMMEELDRFDTLLGDLLEISRHDAGVADLSAERLDVRGTITMAYDQVKAIADELGVEVRFDIPSTPVLADIDSRRVERILRNLFANAIDHAEGNPVDVRLAVGKKALAITVRDYGVGFKPGQELLLFTRFWRADPSRERKTGGTGLGLAISAEDAQLHGGKLEAAGELGVGALFRLTLPLNTGDEVESSPLPLDVILYSESSIDSGRASGLTAPLAIEQGYTVNSEESLEHPVLEASEGGAHEVHAVRTDTSRGSHSADTVDPAVVEIVENSISEDESLTKMSTVDIYTGLTAEEIQRIEQEATDMDVFEAINNAVTESRKEQEDTTDEDE